jgi:cytochrome c-type biogenesis protein
VIDAPFATVFATGMLATFNPCGFAMLPAYLGYFLGLEDDTTDLGTRILRSLGVGAALTAGFVVVFAVLGSVLSGLESLFSVRLDDKLPYVTIPVGLALAGLGIAMLRGYEPTLRLPRLDRGAGSRQAGSMFLFGVSYAVTSFSCTWPLFALAVSNTFSEDGYVTGVAVYITYALGMGLVLMVLTLLVSCARRPLLDRVRAASRYVGRLSGGLLVVAGSYVAYYGWYELQVYGDDLDPPGPAAFVSELNGDVRNWIRDVGAARIGLVLGGIVAAAVLVAAGVRADRRAETRAGRRTETSAEPRATARGGT